MGRGATVAAGNVWYEARKSASEWNEKLKSREGAAELLHVSPDTIDAAERNTYKHMPVEIAVAMADVYNAPQLLNYYCLNECPIGCRRDISDDCIDIERATVQLTRILRQEVVQSLKHGLQDIAEDGEISEEELDDLDEIVNVLKEVSRIVSKLVTIRDKRKKQAKNY